MKDTNETDSSNMDSGDQLDALESKLRRLQPRAARVDLEAVRLEARPVGSSGSEAIKEWPPNPVIVRQHSAWTLAGTWLCGALAGSLLVLLVSQRGESPRRETTGGGTDTAVVTHKVASPLPPPESSRERYRNIRHRHVVAVMNGEANRLSSASHLISQRESTVDIAAEQTVRTSSPEPIAPLPKASAAPSRSRNRQVSDLLQAATF